MPGIVRAACATPTVLRRLISPTELVVRWLDEVHAFGDLASAVAALLAEDEPEPPLDRLIREAAHGARARLKGKPADIVSAEVRRVLRETVFRFELVMRINVTTHGLLDRQALLDAALASQVALLTSEPHAERRRDSRYRSRLASRRDALMACVDELLAAQEARSTVERRYLDSHPALFPAMAAAWEEQHTAIKRLAVVAFGLAEADGCPPFEPPDPDAVSSRTATLVADLVEPAKSTGLAKLGEGERALDIAQRWLRPKLERTGAHNLV